MNAVKRISVIAVITVALLSAVYLIVNVLKDDKENDRVTVITYKTDLGYAYKILVDEKVYIKQEFVPAVSGKFGFCTENDAFKTAELVKTKLLKKGNPTVTKQEIEKLKIKVGCI